MTIAPATENTEKGAKRRIGDILLELGFVGEEALAKAAEDQERTGQPLGQILVEHGAITRLELASALAEQWSDQVSITPLPIPSAPPRVVPQQPQHHDDDQYAARLQEAVADLTQRVRLPDQENPLDSRLIELAERVESTVARTQRLEATVATLVESLEGVTGGVEEAFGVLQSGMSGLAMDLARIEITVTDLNARAAEPTTDPAVAAKIDELWRFVHELADRPHVDDAARGRADALTARLEALADRASLEQVQDSLDAMRASVDDLGELRAAVAELEARPTGSPELDARLERLEARLNEYGAAAADSKAVESLAGRLDAALAAQGSLEATLGAIDERLELLARDVATRAEASLAEQVSSVENRLADLVSGEKLHEATAARLDAVEARLEAELASSTDPEAAKALAALSERIEELSHERHHQQELAARLDGIEARVPTDTVSTAELAAAIEHTRAELAPAPHEPDPRIDDLARELAAVRDELHTATAAKLEAIEARLEAGLASSTDREAAKALAALSDRIEELSRERHLQDELAGRLDALDGRLPGLVTGDELSSALERTRKELAPAPHEPDPRIEATAAKLEAIEARLEAGLASSTDPEAARAIAALSERIEELSRERQQQEGLAAKLDALDARVPTDTVTAAELASAFAEARAEQASAPAPEGNAELEDAVAGLAERLGALDELQARIEELAETVATRPEAGIDDEVRRELDERVSELARTLDEKLVATAEAPAPSAGLFANVEEDIERFRMTLERLSMHIAEHDRTLSEMRSGRGVGQRLDELAAQVDALAAGVVASPDGAPRKRGPGFGRDLEANEMRQLIRRIEDCEEAAHEGREKLMNRLERMASSIDWRLQRLEADEPSE